MSDVKNLLSEMGLRWGPSIEPNPIQPVCKGMFRGNLIAIYQESANDVMSEIKCLTPEYASGFEELLQSFMNPVEEQDES